jgi:hypothetical protein
MDDLQVIRQLLMDGSAGDGSLPTYCSAKLTTMPTQQQPNSGYHGDPAEDGRPGPAIASGNRAYITPERSDLMTLVKPRSQDDLQ